MANDSAAFMSSGRSFHICRTGKGIRGSDRDPATVSCRTYKSWAAT